MTIDGYIAGNLCGNKYKLTSINSLFPESIGVKLYIVVIFKGYSALTDMQQAVTEHLLYCLLCSLVNLSVAKTKPQMTLSLPLCVCLFEAVCIFLISLFLKQLGKVSSTF